MARIKLDCTRQVVPKVNIITEPRCLFKIKRIQNSKLFLLKVRLHHGRDHLLPFSPSLQGNVTHFACQKLLAVPNRLSSVHELTVPCKMAEIIGTRGGGLGFPSADVLKIYCCMDSVHF